MTAVIVRVSVTALLLLTCPLAPLAQPRPGAFTTLTASTSVTSPSVVVTGSGAAALDVTGGINAGSGNVGIVGTDGRIPAISSTYFANLSGTNITGVAITTAPAMISGAWVFTTEPMISGAAPFMTWDETDQGADGKRWRWVSSGGTFSLQTVDDAGSVTATGLFFTRSGNAPLAATFQTAVAYASAIAPAALASGSTNNYNPTGLSAAAYVVLAADAGGSTLTGLTAQPSGTEITLCEPVTTAGSLTIAHESGSSTAANRFNNGAQANITLNKDTSSGVGGPCVTYWYYGAGARWLLKTTSGSVP